LKEEQKAMDRIEDEDGGEKRFEKKGKARDHDRVRGRKPGIHKVEPKMARSRPKMRGTSRFRTIVTRCQLRYQSNSPSAGKLNYSPSILPNKPIRTLFYVPGSSQKMIDKAWTLQADNIVHLL
jgi:hypothetical protein